MAPLETLRAVTDEQKHRLRAKGLKKKNSSGQAMVEFVFVAVTFFFVSFAVIDFSWLLFNQMNMQNAVREAGRYASTGNHLKDPATGATLSRAESISRILKYNAVGSNIEKIVISSEKGGVGSPGGPSDTVTVQAVCDVPMLTSVIGKLFGTDNRFHFTVSSTFKNEPFSPTLTR